MNKDGQNDGSTQIAKKLFQTPAQSPGVIYGSENRATPLKNTGSGGKNRVKGKSTSKVTLLSLM